MCTKERGRDAAAPAVPEASGRETPGTPGPARREATDAPAVPAARSSPRPARPEGSRPALASLPSARLVVIVVMAATAVTLTVIGIVITVNLPPEWFPGIFVTPDLAGGLTFPVVAAFLLAHRSRPATAWLMSAGGLGCAINVFGSAMMCYSGASGDLTAAGYYRYAGGIGWVVGGTLLAIVLPLYSPDGRLPSRRWRPLVVMAVAVMVVETVRLVVRPAPPAKGYLLPQIIPNPLAIDALAPYNLTIQNSLAGLINLLAVLSLLSLVLRARRADPVLRRQIAWPLTAFAVYVVFLLAGSAWHVAATVATGLIPVAIAFSVLRYRLYGIDTVVSRAFVAAGLISAVSAVYFGVGALAGLTLSDYDRIGGLTAALFAGVVFHPLRLVLRRWVDRLMYGTHGDPRALAARLAHEVGGADPANALAAVTAVIRDGLSVTGVAVEVDDPGIRRVEAGLLGPAPRTVPLVWHGEPVGRLLLGAPGPRRFAAAHNDRLIAVVTPYVADVVHAVRMTADLQRLRGGMDAVGQEIRELVYGLRPPTLDDLGLAGAVRALAAEGEPQVAVETEGDLSDLPAAAEVAAYRIAQEGLTNIRKHARAHSATVSLRRGESLVVRVQDDGHGLPAVPRSGIGLLSMRERAAELGGTCVIGAAPGGGTVVEAVLPISAAQT
ncbi:sensor histidine kinase [Streptosporangium roseum]|uniref:sensor histidine kinase n=1 Tax=Streptosporangium roseum TaxID=2001 RepID=UPI000560EAC5|nr:ATP-binding protein [Streptosporangium roseum]